MYECFNKWFKMLNNLNHNFLKGSFSTVQCKIMWPNIILDMCYIPNQTYTFLMIRVSQKCISLFVKL